MLYAAGRKARGPSADYWDHATLLEVAVLARDDKAAKAASRDALAAARQEWHLTTTVGNLALIRDKRAAAGEDVAALGALIASLQGAAERLKPKGAEA